MSWDLDGRVALITGGASGIGAELARQLARKGMRIGADRRDASGWTRSSRGAETAVADVRDAEQLTAAIDDLAAAPGRDRRRRGQRRDRHGRPAAAGRARDRRGDDRRQPARRLAHGPGRAAARARAPRPSAARRLGGGRAARGGPRRLRASKAGVEGLGRALRVELRPHGVSLGVAYYLFLQTPMVAAGRGARPCSPRRPAGCRRRRRRGRSSRPWPGPWRRSRSVPAIVAPAVPARADGRARRCSTARCWTARRRQLDPGDGAGLRRRGRAHRP